MVSQFRALTDFVVDACGADLNGFEFSISRENIPWIKGAGVTNEEIHS